MDQRRELRIRERERLRWGPFVEYLPNYNDYVDGTAADIIYDFGNPTEGYEAPYGKAQMVFWVDGAKITETPKNPEEFLAFCKAHPGQVSYPEPGDFTGTVGNTNFMAINGIVTMICAVAAWAYFLILRKERKEGGL